MLKIETKSIIFLVAVCFNIIRETNASLQPIEITDSSHSSETSTAYEFTPLATIIGFAFIAICFLVLAIAKIMFASSDQYMMNNRYDLVIFKAPTKNTVMGPRRVYSNNTANTHNLNAAQACGFDVSMLNTRNPYNLLSNLSNLSNSTPSTANKIN